MARLALFVTLLAAIAGCGARSGLLLEESEGVDGGPARDAGDLGDAETRRDAGTDAGVVMCPTPSGIGFGLRHAGRLELPRSLVPGELALGGDGVRVFLAVSSRDGATPGLLWELSPSLEPIDELPFGNGHSLAISVDDDVVRLATLSNDDAGLVIYEGARASTARVRLSDVDGAPLFRLARPAWNGTDVVIAGDETASGIFVGALVDDAVSPAWLATGPASFAEVAVEPSTGVTHVLYQGGASNRVLERLDREGNALTPPGGVLLADVGFVGPVALGFSDDVRLGSLVLAGVTEEEDGDRVTLRRFRTDGTPGAGFSMAMTLGPDGTMSLTTVPPTGHRRGYGLVASDGTNVRFHGAGEDFVGDGRGVPITCDGQGGAAIASAPCGYLIACLNGGGIEFAWALPQPPR